MRIELSQLGHIQVREIRDGEYHRSVKHYKDDLSNLSEKCDIILLSNNTLLLDAHVKEVIEYWSKDDFPEIKEEL